MMAAKPELPETPPPRFFVVTPRYAASSAFYLGMAMGCASIAMLGYTIASWMLGSAVNGWTSLAMIALAIGSKQLLAHGVFGDALGRLYAETDRRPLAIADTISPMDQTRFEEAGVARRIAA